MAPIRSLFNPGEEPKMSRPLIVAAVASREAARECRRKKKEYVSCLENRVAVLEQQNKTLIEELRALKDIYGHKVEWLRCRGDGQLGIPWTFVCFSGVFLNGIWNNKRADTKHSSSLIFCVHTMMSGFRGPQLSNTSRTNESEY